MPEWLPSIPYPPQRTDGYWEPVTSTLDWCEENYYATRYSAEIVNTLTNLLFIILAFKGIHNCIKHGHDRIFLLTFVGYLVVGSGSFAFHTTLKYPMQLVDELSMIYTTCLMFWATFEHNRAPPFPAILAVTLASLALFITGYYHYLQDPTFHQNAYAILTAVVLIHSMYVMERDIRPWYRERRKARQWPRRSDSLGNSASFGLEANGAIGTNGTIKRNNDSVPSRGFQKMDQKRQDNRDREILRQMWWMIAVGLSIFLGGFVVWSLDNAYCSKLRRWRHEIGLPWGLLLEGHGWWHLMTGYGAYFYIVWGIWLRHCLNGRQDDFELVWPSLWTSIPIVVKRSMANGSVKKDS